MPAPGSVWTAHSWADTAWAVHTWQDATEVSGQSPRASRYRFAYQLSDVIRMWLLWL